MDAAAEGWPGMACSPSVAVEVPVCLRGKMAEEMARRMLSGDWVYWTSEECEASMIEKPSRSFLLGAQKHFGMKRTRVEDKACAWCGICSIGARKCSNCLVTYYCDGACQRLHWRIHKGVCWQPAPRVSNEEALVLPDYQCCHSYVEVCQDAGAMPLLIVSRTLFIEYFGSAGEQRTLLELAAKGRPAQYFLNVTFP